jgi:hypothetical protein
MCQCSLCARNQVPFLDAYVLNPTDPLISATIDGTIAHLSHGSSVAMATSAAGSGSDQHSPTTTTTTTTTTAAAAAVAAAAVAAGTSISSVTDSPRIRPQGTNSPFAPQSPRIEAVGSGPPIPTWAAPGSLLRATSSDGAPAIPFDLEVPELSFAELRRLHTTRQNTHAAASRTVNAAIATDTSTGGKSKSKPKFGDARDALAAATTKTMLLEKAVLLEKMGLQAQIISTPVEPPPYGAVSVEGAALFTQRSGMGLKENREVDATAEYMQTLSTLGSTSKHGAPQLSPRARGGDGLGGGVNAFTVRESVTVPPLAALNDWDHPAVETNVEQLPNVYPFARETFGITAPTDHDKGHLKLPGGGSILKQPVPPTPGAKSMWGGATPKGAGLAGFRGLKGSNYGSKSVQ